MEVNMRRFFGILLILGVLIMSGCLESSKPAESSQFIAPVDELKNTSPVAIAPSQGYIDRKNIYIKDALSSLGIDAQVVHIAYAEPVAEAPILAALAKADARKDCADFGFNAVLRMLCLDRETNSLPAALREQMKKSVLNFKYWFDEPGKDTMIMWTENHQLLFHAAEIMAGNLYPDEIFTNSGMTGAEHAAHAKHWINSWLKLRGRLGMTEFHSNIYYNETMPALLNLVDFSNDIEISTKAAMMLDLLAFDLANNYFKGAYATAHGRTEDRYEVGYGYDMLPGWESTNETAWLMLGLSEHKDPSHFTAAFMATSDYFPPAILEEIAADALLYNEHRERSSITIDEASQYGVGFETDEDMTYWWTMSALLAPYVIDSSLELMERYDMSGGLGGIDDNLIQSFVKFLAKTHFTTPTGYSKMISALSEGIMLSSASTYTYRTPYYQLSGVQDHQKAMNGLQELIWQANLDRYATVFTNSPPGLRGEDYMGGWKPRATFYKNVGIIQYDREPQLPLVEIALFGAGTIKSIIEQFYTGNGDLLEALKEMEIKAYTRAYFPKWAFDEVITKDHWIFARKDDGYVGLYSLKTPSWNENNIEIRASGKQNLWIVEMGSKAENGSFESFMEGLTGAKITAKVKVKGYDVKYESPSQGLVNVGWDGPMLVAGKNISIGTYKRFDNKYCSQEFGTEKTVIDFNGKSLELDFANATRTYWDMRMNPN